MENSEQKKKYRAELEERGVLPEGFKAETVTFPFRPREKGGEDQHAMNLSALLLPEGTPVFGGVFTQNRAPGAPVCVGREILRSERSYGVLVNNKIANVCAPGGEADAREVTDAFTRAAGFPENGVFPASTGVIGWKLPVPEMKVGAAELWEKLKAGPCGSIVPLAEGIMTTDAFPKVRSIECGSGRIVAAAKGAGMIEPDMATMLVFIASDVTIDRRASRKILSNTVSRTFNRISVDGDQSTSDMVLLFDSCMQGPVSKRFFEEALSEVCGKLAEDIVRNGEGTAHVIRVEVKGCRSEAEAAAYGKGIINSPLVKTAVFGNDPNVGRIIMALGDVADAIDSPFHADRTEIRLGSDTVFTEGTFRLDEEKERALSEYLRSTAMAPEVCGYPQHEECVEMTVDFGMGKARAEVIGSDLSYGYIKENADYRS